MIAFLIHIWLYACLFAGGVAWLLVMAAAALGSNMERLGKNNSKASPFSPLAPVKLSPSTTRRIWAVAAILL